MADQEPIIVKPISKNPGGGQWMPTVGNETNTFLESVVPESSRDYIRDTAISILSKCVSPSTSMRQETGLVIGYVQSGKTMSFEAVAALAHDNSFQMVIIIAGISNNLLMQSTERLYSDLQIGNRNLNKRWIMLENPSNNESNTLTIRKALRTWSDSKIQKSHKRTLLITVLKQHQRLKQLISLLQKVDKNDVPVLIIDDEADQASLNTKADQVSRNTKIAPSEESTTYRHLMDLRDSLPSHTYLQYTATPQAPLLVSIIDSLSPNFVQILDAGTEYAGGKEFFGGDHMYVRVIPPQDVPTKSNLLSEPPSSLIEALRIFMVGVAAKFSEGYTSGNRSMLVHPSSATLKHTEFYKWIRSVVDEWTRTLNLPDDDPDRQGFLEEFLEAYNSLVQTKAENLPSFEDLSQHLRAAFSMTHILEVNSRGGSTPPVEWDNAYSWILVGGQAMDRGFTIEGLTVTYMPRGIGTGNADMIQQRARFFGYKKSYLGYCRVYLEQDTLDAFISYIDHEEDIRNQLGKIQDGGQSLNDWKRAFVLDKALRPCRNNVLEFDYMRGIYSNKWAAPRIAPILDSVISNNRSVVDNFLKSFKFVDADGHPKRTIAQKHRLCKNVPLHDVMKQLMIPIRITDRGDSQRHTGLLLQLSKALENSCQEVCTIYIMSPFTKKHRSRGIDEKGEITNLFQGEAPVNPAKERGTYYPGDRNIRDIDNVTVQIHTLSIKKRKSNVVIHDDVPVIAVWVPARLKFNWVASHNQPGQRDASEA